MKMIKQKSAHSLLPIVVEEMKLLGKPSGVTDVVIEAATVSIVLMKSL